uniref:Dynein regulatory complex protein 12 n=1 Tax=Bicosoecida sp. CB-2014 TaxID=1486930 RepID=A0A7S1CEK7_9STRA|mmetsp:Transcript_22353/g.78331  ORF Transcript_22353/g.78331 Transcript_22353/m.78331 type:complete len:204 (+) Transcript_22353:58-669(+)
MPPKKGKGKGKGKKKGGDGDDDGGDISNNPVALAKAYEMQNAALRRQLAERTDAATEAIKARRELSERVETLKKDFEEERDSTFEITADMTRQYKAMQEELLGRINSLENTINDLKDKLEESKVTLERTIKEKDEVIDSKEDEIAQLRSKMEEMASEFGDMLQETLKKMSERIEVSNSKWESDTGVPVIRKLEEFNMGGAGGR